VINQLMSQEMAVLVVTLIWQTNQLMEVQNKQLQIRLLSRESKMVVKPLATMLLQTWKVINQRNDP